VAFLGPPFGKKGGPTFQDAYRTERRAAKSIVPDILKLRDKQKADEAAARETQESEGMVSAADAPALSPKADMCSAKANVRFWAAFDHLVGALSERRRYRRGECLPFKNGVLAPGAFQLAFERGAVIEAVKA